MQKEEKIQELRTAFYEMGDKIQELLRYSKTIENKKAAMKMIQILTQSQNEWMKLYQWANYYLTDWD